MFDKFAKIFDKAAKSPSGYAEEKEGSLGITDEKLIRRFTDNPDFPYLVSFPRTGSHWLRMLMELYFEKPSLVRVFYFKTLEDFTCYHWHDEDLKLQRKNVIYLYRHPVPTVFSQLNYYKEDTSDQARICYWSTLYARHLKKWLMTERFTTRKTVLTYETLQSRLSAEFQKVCRHFGASFDEAKLLAASGQVTKENLKKKTGGYDQQIVNLSRTYEHDREDFKAKQAQFVMEKILAQDNALGALFR